MTTIKMFVGRPITFSHKKKFCYIVIKEREYPHHMSWLHINNCTNNSMNLQIHQHDKKYGRISTEPDPEAPDPKLLGISLWLYIFRPHSFKY